MPTQMFTCDKCCAPHNSEADAAACEKRHTDFQLVKAHYSRVDPKIPFALTIRFDGGREASYQFKPGHPDND